MKNPHHSKTALDHFNLIETASDREEAEIVALILRQAIEIPGQTAALVTPDRRLARRVFARMEKWGLLIDDSWRRTFAAHQSRCFF